LVINEVFFRGKDTDLEFVELFNASATSIDLATLQFSDSRRKPVSVSNGPYRLEPGGYAVITRNVTTFDARFTFPSRIEIKGWPALNNSGDAVILWINDTVVDSVEYSTSWGGNDVSLERIDPAGSSSARSNWAESLDRLGGTPGQINSVFAPDVGPPRMVFCEEIADGTLAVHFSEPLSTSTVAPSSFRFESGATAKDATLDGSKQVVLLTTDSDARDLWIAVSGISDESGNVLEQQQIPIAWLPEPGELILNEIMYEPLANEFDGLSNQSEYVELLSVTNRSLSIRSVVLTDRLREDGTRDTTDLSDRRLTIEPGTFILVYARRDPSEDPLEAFPGIDRSNPRLLLLPITARSLSFGNNGDKVRLERWGGIVVDEVEYAPFWHLAERVETRGVSLERISSRAATQNPSNWSSSANPAGGTPGGPNSIRFGSGGDPKPASLVIEPSPFSPNGDGFEDVA
ncbi:MAG: lamin tail domain-containing protein, partial [Rhodothermia bacterium]